MEGESRINKYNRKKPLKKECGIVSRKKKDPTALVQCCETSIRRPRYSEADKSKAQHREMEAINDEEESPEVLY